VCSSDLTLSVDAGVSDTVHLPASADLPERMEVTLTRGGSRSAFGDLVATYQPADGSTAIIIGRISRLAVYTPNAKRNVVMTLQVPDGVRLTSGGKINVPCRATENEGGNVLAEQTISLN